MARQPRQPRSPRGPSEPAPPEPPEREDPRRVEHAEREAAHWRSHHTTLAHERDGQRDEIDRLRARLDATGPSVELVAKIRTEERARIAHIVAHVMDRYPNDFARIVKAELLKWLDT